MQASATGPWTTVVTRKDGTLMYGLLVVALTPVGKRLHDSFTKGLQGFFILCYGIFLIDNWNKISFETLAATTVMWSVAFVAIKSFAALALSAREKSKIDYKELAHRQWWGWSRFSLDFEHSLVMIQHPKAKLEAQQNALKVQEANAKGKIISPPLYYGESYQIVFESEGKRKVLATIYGEVPATAALMQYQYCFREAAASAKLAMSHNRTVIYAKISKE